MDLNLKQTDVAELLQLNQALGDEEFCEGYGLSVSPDGKTLAVVQGGGWLYDAVLLKG